MRNLAVQDFESAEEASTHPGAPTVIASCKSTHQPWYRDPTTHKPGITALWRKQVEARLADIEIGTLPTTRTAQTYWAVKRLGTSRGVLRLVEERRDDHNNPAAIPPETIDDSATGVPNVFQRSTRPLRRAESAGARCRPSLIPRDVGTSGGLLILNR
jgi:hypothetical protein